VIVDRTLTQSAISARSGAELLTAEVVIPGSAPENGSVRFVVDLSDATRINPDTRVSIELERFDTATGQWLHICGQHAWYGVDAEDPDTGEKYLPQCMVNVTTGGSVGGVRQPRYKRGWRVRGRIHDYGTIALGWRLQIVVLQ
jgi:hypothetical protein